MPYRYYNDKEEDYHKPPAFSRDFQKEMMVQIWEIKTEVEALKEEIKRLRYHSHNNNSNEGGGAFTN